jgi:hypothetical protein
MRSTLMALQFNPNPFLLTHIIVKLFCEEVRDNLLQRYSKTVEKKDEN